VGAVAWPRANTPGALAGLVAGHALVLIYQFNLVPIPNPFPVPLAPGLIVGLAANITLLVVISYAMGPVSRERIEKFHGYLAREL
jgi:Na+/proline symporter